jgi:hypothetical protein
MDHLSKEEIKEALERILGSNITMRPDSSTDEDRLKKDFIKLMNLYEEVWARQSKLGNEYQIDFATYDDKFFNLVEGFISFCFDETAAKAITFYVYTRKINKDVVAPFIDPNEKEHIFNDVDDLWDFLIYWAEEMMRP